MHYNWHNPFQETECRVSCHLFYLINGLKVDNEPLLQLLKAIHSIPPKKLLEFDKGTYYFYFKNYIKEKELLFFIRVISI